MTKADIVNEISRKTGVDKVVVLNNVEAFMDIIKDSLSKNENVYLRGFGSFVVKKRAQKTARNITEKYTMIIPAHNIPSFKPAKTFVTSVKETSCLPQYNLPEEQGGPKRRKNASKAEENVD